MNSEFSALQLSSPDSPCPPDQGQSWKSDEIHYWNAGTIVTQSTFSPSLVPTLTEYSHLFLPPSLKRTCTAVAGSEGSEESPVQFRSSSLFHPFPQLHRQSMPARGPVCCPRRKTWRQPASLARTPGPACSQSGRDTFWWGVRCSSWRGTRPSGNLGEQVGILLHRIVKERPALRAGNDKSVGVERD